MENASEQPIAIASLIPLGLVYGEGLVWAVVITAFVFVFIAYTGGEWFIGAGLVCSLLAALHIYTGWRHLADYPLTYRDGDRPVSTTSGISLYETWRLGPGAVVDTQFTLGDGVDATTLAGELHQHGCPSSVDWRVYVGGNLLASGTLANRGDRELDEVPVPSEWPVVVRLLAVRTDSADCTTELSWENPGFEGPGHGKFRFVFPLPETE